MQGSVCVTDFVKMIELAIRSSHPVHVGTNVHFIRGDVFCSWRRCVLFTGE